MGHYALQMELSYVEIKDFNVMAILKPLVKVMREARELRDVWRASFRPQEPRQEPQMPIETAGSDKGEGQVRRLSYPPTSVPSPMDIAVSCFMVHWDCGRYLRWEWRRLMCWTMWRWRLVWAQKLQTH